MHWWCLGEITVLLHVASTQETAFCTQLRKQSLSQPKIRNFRFSCFSLSTSILNELPEWRGSLDLEYLLTNRLEEDHNTWQGASYGRLFAWRLFNQGHWFCVCSVVCRCSILLLLFDIREAAKALSTFPLHQETTRRQSHIYLLKLELAVWSQCCSWHNQHENCLSYSGGCRTFISLLLRRNTPGGVIAHNSQWPMWKPDCV